MYTPASLRRRKEDYPFPKSSSSYVMNHHPNLPSCCCLLLLLPLGDHLQLPPTVLSDEAAKAGLANTLFERLQASLGAAASCMLTVQYRMNSAIMDWSSHELYDVSATHCYNSFMAMLCVLLCYSPVCGQCSHVAFYVCAQFTTDWLLPEVTKLRCFVGQASSIIPLWAPLAAWPVLHEPAHNGLAAQLAACLAVCITTPTTLLLYVLLCTCYVFASGKLACRVN